MSSKDKSHCGISDKERPAALVVCSYLGWPITGGVAAAIRQLIYFLHSIGLVIYCTTFKVNKEDQNEFRKFGTKLIYPDPPELYQLDKEDISWLHHHKTYFPAISKIERVKLVFGFSMLTSYQAFAIKDTTFPNASFYLVNPYKLDTPLCILGYNEKKRKIWEKIVMKGSRDAKAVISISSEIFKHFDSFYKCFETKINHLALLLTPDDDLFEIACPTNIPESGNFRILMFVDENDIAELTHKSVVAKAMNSMAKSFYDSGNEPPKWIIVSIAKGREDTIKRNLKPHPHLEIIYKSFEATEVITSLQQSHLVLVPPSSVNSMILSLSTIATGTPLLVPLFSASFKTVMEYLPDLDSNDISVDMKSGHSKLCDKIKMVVLHYPVYQKRALEMRGILKAKTNEVSRRMKTELIELVCRHEDITLDNPSDVAVVAQGHTTETNVSPNSDIYKTELAAKRRKIGNDNTTQECDFEADNVEDTSQADPGNDDKNGKSSQVDVRLNVQGGAPENDRQMDDVGNDFFRHESTQTNAQVYMDKITNIHPELQGKDIGKGSLNFTIGCGSQDAADALWDAYSSGRLDRMADETFLSIPLLNDIGVRMLSLETFIDYQKYLQCKQDITEREIATETPDISILQNEKDALQLHLNAGRDNASVRKHELKEKQNDRDSLKSIYVDEGKVFEAAERRMEVEWLSLKARPWKVGQQLRVKVDELKLEKASIIENMDMQRKKLMEQLDEVNRKIQAMPEQNFLRTNELLNKMSNLTWELSNMDDSYETETMKLRVQISEVNAELDLCEKNYDNEMRRLTELQQKLPDEIIIIAKRITECKEIDQLIQSLFCEQDLKGTVGELPREGNGAGEVCNLNTVHDNDDDQPGTVKIVTEDTQQLISTITFYSLPKIFKPIDVKISNNKLYYIVDDGNKCILVCDAKSRLKQIIDIGEVRIPVIRIGTDNTVLVSDQGGRVIKYSNAGEMISKYYE